MSRAYDKLTRNVLAKELRARKVLPGWAVNYLTKTHIIEVLRYIDTRPEGTKVKLSDDDWNALKARRAAHVSSTKTARVQRNERHGTTNLTRRELLLHVVNSYPGLRFLEQRVYDTPFDSPTGNTRATVANVFVDAEGNEHNFTRAECRTMHNEFGMEMPKKAFQHARKSAADVARAQGKRTFDDLW